MWYLIYWRLCCQNILNNDGQNRGERPLVLCNNSGWQLYSGRCYINMKKVSGEMRMRDEWKCFSVTLTGNIWRFPSPPPSPSYRMRVAAAEVWRSSAAQIERESHKISGAFLLLGKSLLAAGSRAAEQLRISLHSLLKLKCGNMKLWSGREAPGWLGRHGIRNICFEQF